MASAVIAKLLLPLDSKVCKNKYEKKKYKCLKLNLHKVMHKIKELYYLGKAENIDLTLSQTRIGNKYN